MAKTIFKNKDLLLSLTARVKQKKSVQRVFNAILKKVPTRIIAVYLVNVKNSDVQIVLANLLRLKKDAAAIPFLIRLLRSTKNPLVLSAIVETLGDLNAKEAASDILRLFRDKNQPIYVRDNAAISIGLLQYKRATPYLKSEMKSSHRTIKECSRKALKMISGKP